MKIVISDWRTTVINENFLFVWWITFVCFYVFRWTWLLLAAYSTALQLPSGLHQPVIPAGDSECALLLDGPGRTSHFDYQFNLLRGAGSPPHRTGQTCITYDAVNAAYLEARKRVQVAQPHGDYKPEDIATVGELLLDISVNLARTYGLSYEEIEKGLPLIDTSRTLIREVSIHRIQKLTL